MDENALKQLKTINEIDFLLEFIKPYYPDIEIKEFTIETIEKALFDTFIKVVGKLIYNSPPDMRLFLKAYLLNYEISNIKHIVLNLLAGSSKIETTKNVNFLVEEIRGKESFIRQLLDATTSAEIQFFTKDSIYKEAIKEGLLFFENSNEIFLLTSFLDKKYYDNYLEIEKSFSKKEKKIFSLFISIICEIYNINFIYRGILNNTEKNFLSQFLVNRYLFLDEKNLISLLNQPTLETYFLFLNNLLKKVPELKKWVNILDSESKHPMWILEKVYMDYFFRKLKEKAEDIDYSAIYLILKLIVKKEEEIRFKILPRVVKLIHYKYRDLKQQLK